MSENKPERSERLNRISFMIRAAFMILTTASIGLAVYWLLRFRIMPEIILVCYVLMNFIFLLFLWYLFFRTGHRWTPILGYLLGAGIIIVSLQQSQSTENEYEMIQEIRTDNHQTGNFVELYTLDSSAVRDSSDLNNRKIGVLKNMDSEERKLMEDWIKESGAEYTITEYDSSLDMVRNLKGAAIDAIIINQPYLEVIKGYPGLKTFDRDIRSVHQIELSTEQSGGIQEADNQDNRKSQNETYAETETVSITEKPFTVLITGSNSYGALKEFDNNDMNILAAVNPESRTIMLVRLPRDLYVQTECASGKACPAGQLEKLAYSGLFGIETTEKTVEKIFDIPVNYYIRFNFTFLSTLVNQFGGIEIDNPDAFRSRAQGYYFPEGSQILHGDQAIAYSSESRVFKRGDYTRGENQMRILKGILEKSRNPEVFEILDTIIKAHEEDMQTNLKSEDLQELIRLESESSKNWTIYTYSVYGTGDHLYSPHFNDDAYVLVPDQKRIENAGRDIHAVLNNEKPLYVD